MLAGSVSSEWERFVPGRRLVGAEAGGPGSVLVSLRFLVESPTSLALKPLFKRGPLNREIEFALKKEQGSSCTTG